MAATMQYAADEPVNRSPVSFLWDRRLRHYPDNGQRYLSLGIVVLTTIVLYYQLYIAGAVATNIIGDYHMSFVYYVNISVVGYILGAVASVVAGLADRYGRANIVTAGLLLTGLLSLIAIPNAHSKLAFGIYFVLIGFVEGIVLVATPALVRDFSPQLGRASAMGFWTLGPVLGSLVVSEVASHTFPNHLHAWQDQFIIAGIAGLVVFLLALFFLRELAPKLRDQLMVSSRDRALIEARAKGIDVEASLRKPFRQMLHLDIVGSAFAISVFLIIYYVAVGFFPIFFETVFGFTPSQANSLGNWFWAFDAGGLLVVGFLSDLLRVRKPFMIVGGILSIVFTTLFALRATDPKTSYHHFVILLVLIAVSLGIAYAPWMAGFTETAERRNPALTATGLAVWGLVIRVVIAVSIFFIPHVVNTVTPLVEKGPIVQASANGTDPTLTPAQNAVVKAVAADPTIVTKVQAIAARDASVIAAATAHPDVVAKVAQIAARDATVIAAVQAHPALVAQLAAATANGGAVPPALLATAVSTLGVSVLTQLNSPAVRADLTYLEVTAPATLGAANFAALSNPATAADLVYANKYAALSNPTVQARLKYLQANAPAVQSAAKRSPKQWKTYFFIAVGGEVVFIPLIFTMAGFWDPRKARKAEQEHEAMVAAEMAKLAGAPAV